jgi:hypothetical protein
VLFKIERFMDALWQVALPHEDKNRENVDEQLVAGEGDK